VSAVACLMESKKVTSKKGQKIMVQVGYLPSPPTQPIATKIGVGCPVADVINRAKFQLDRFMGFRAPDGRKSLSPIDLRHHPYNSYALPCYTVIKKRTHDKITGRVLNSYLIAGNWYLWPRDFNRIVPGGLGFSVHRWLKQCPSWQVSRKSL